MRDRLSRALFGRGDSTTFLSSDRSLTKAYGMAIALAGARGTDDVDLLSAALDAKVVRKRLQMLGFDARAMASKAAIQEHAVKEPGLTDDAKRVIEAVGLRALERKRDATVIDLLVALVTTAGRAQVLMREMGVGEVEVASLVE